MAAVATERVLDVRHWTDDYFSFTTTRDLGLRFENGQFVMIGLLVDQRPLLRAYSIASANWEEELQFFSIKVPDGLLTSRLRHLRPGDAVLVGSKPTGTLLVSDLHPGRTLYLFATGTGLAPFLAVVKDPGTYERFERVVLTHGVRASADLAYRDYIERELPQDPYLGEVVRRQLRYYPAVSREVFANQGRLTELFEQERMSATLDLAAPDPAHDRAMICGSPQMLVDFRRILDAKGFRPSPRIGAPGHYVYERAFVER